MKHLTLILIATGVLLLCSLIGTCVVVTVSSDAEARTKATNLRQSRDLERIRVMCIAARREC